MQFAEVTDIHAVVSTAERCTQQMWHLDLLMQSCGTSVLCLTPGLGHAGKKNSNQTLIESPMVTVTLFKQIIQRKNLHHMMRSPIKTMETIKDCTGFYLIVKCLVWLSIAVALKELKKKI